MRKSFKFGELVRVKMPGSRAFAGTVYSAYKASRNSHRMICVNTPAGAGVAFPIRYVFKRTRMRTTRKIRFRFDFVLDFNEELDGLLVSHSTLDAAIGAAAEMIAKGIKVKAKKKTIDLLPGGRVKADLDFRK